MLRDRVEDFIAHRARPAELHELLWECMNDGSVEGLACVRRLYEDMYGRMTHNFELKAAAASCLLFWGEAGLRALIDGEKTTPEYKNTSLCVQILSSIAAGRPFPLLPFISDSRIEQRIRATHAKLIGIDEFARKMLIQFVLSRESDDDVASLATRVSMGDDENMGAAKEVFAAISARWLAVGEPVLLRFESMIAEHPSDEPRFQQFLTAHPQLLDPMAIQVWPQPNLLGSRYPDFVVRRADNSYLVIEIECPAKSLIRGGQASAAVTHAEQQATDYRDYLMKRHQDAIKHFPEFNDPDCLVVTGLEKELNETQNAALRHLNRHRVRLRVVGFDWLIERARNIANNMTRHRVEVVKARIS